MIFSKICKFKLLNRRNLLLRILLFNWVFHICGMDIWSIFWRPRYPKFLTSSCSRWQHNNVLETWKFEFYKKQKFKIAHFSGSLKQTNTSGNLKWTKFDENNIYFYCYQVCQISFVSKVITVLRTIVSFLIFFSFNSA